MEPIKYLPEIGPKIPSTPNEVLKQLLANPFYRWEFETCLLNCMNFEGKFFYIVPDTSEEDHKVLPNCFAKAREFYKKCCEKQK
jgi:hypothetical protein